MSNLKDCSGVFGVRKGKWKGWESVFTHHNPKDGTIWGEDIPGCEGMGRWVPYDEVIFYKE